MKKFLFTFLLSILVFSLSAQNDSEDKITTLINEGIELYDASDYQGAIKKYQEVLDSDNKNLLALAELALTYHVLQQYDECIDICKKAIKHHKKSKQLISVYVTYGNTLDIIGKTKKAKKIYKQGIKKFPKAPMLYFNYGITLAKLGDTEESLDCFQKSSQLNPNHASSHYVQSLIASDLRMRVPAILVGWRFLILEPTGERAKIMQKGISNLMKGSAKKTGENQVSITLNSMMLETKQENDFSMVEMIIDLSGATDLGEDDDDDEPKTDEEKLVAKIETICDMLSEDGNSKKGFYWEHFAPYFKQLNDEGHAETLAYLIQLSTNEKTIQDWMEKNGAKVDDFYRWSDNYEWK
ncbi:MAG: tetratricopeptide repeat protein [Saprospiraceae bacterium]